MVKIARKINFPKASRSGSIPVRCRAGGMTSRPPPPRSGSSTWQAQSSTARKAWPSQPARRWLLCPERWTPWFASLGALGQPIAEVWVSASLPRVYLLLVSADTTRTRLKFKATPPRDPGGLPGGFLFAYLPGPFRLEQNFTKC